jgi:hypothetical protein
MPVPTWVDRYLHLKDSATATIAGIIKLSKINVRYAIACRDLDYSGDGPNASDDKLKRLCKSQFSGAESVRNAVAVGPSEIIGLNSGSNPTLPCFGTGLIARGLREFCKRL